MKIKIEVDTTPQELRQFFGLPDVEPLQEALMEKLQEQVAAGVEGFDPATLMKPFLPANMQGLEWWQKEFWKAFEGKKEGSG